MDVLDLILCAAVIGFAISGYRQGFVVGVLSLVGFVGGALLGAQLAAPLARFFGLTGDGGKAPSFGLLAVIGFAVIGQVLAATVGAVLRARLTWIPLRQADAVAGALISAVSVLLVAWGLARVATRTPLDAVNRQVADSTVLARVNDVIPGGADHLLASLLRLVDETGFPQVFPGLGAETIVPAAPPDKAVLALPGVRSSYLSVWHVRGDNGCGQSVAGSSFVFAKDHLMTNAHVVAGVKAPTVTSQDGRTLPATVVLFDPHRDVAVLYVPGLTGKVLSFAAPVKAGASGVVAGYPGEDPFTAKASRVRSVTDIPGPDIYQHEVTRNIQALFTQVRPGNSGGPLLDSSGRVDGVVFAASTTDANLGYALSAAEVAPDAAGGRTATAGVSTQSCD